MTGLTLSELKPRTVTVEVTEGERVLLRIPLAALSWSEYHEINMSVEEPEAPLKKDFKGGKYVYTPKTEGPEAVAYQAAKTEVLKERRKRLLAVSLIRGGNLAELADAPLSEQAAAIDQMDTAYVRVLYAAMDDLVWRANQKVADMAERFQPDDLADSENLPAERVEPGTMAATAS